VLQLGPLRFPCALGRGGCRARKREGDGATPIGRWVMRCVLYRADRGGRPCTLLPSVAIPADAGWCDAASDRNYNRPVRHPYPARAEHLWRQDGLYDVLVVLGYNDRPRVRGLGSAIFLHVAKGAGAPTEGCIAVARSNLLRLLARLAPGARLRVLPQLRPKPRAPMQGPSNCRRGRRGAFGPTRYHTMCAIGKEHRRRSRWDE
jgi:L,D-peptidoglycan transpeptidase YkuD (ErfK/YbiS/YcfS/YnhG family)